MNNQNQFANNVSMLVSMGFNQQQAMLALNQAQGNFDLAIQYLTGAAQPMMQPQAQAQQRGA